MPEPLRITLIVLSALLAGYLLLLVMNLIFYTFFKHTLHKHERGFTVLLATKLEDIKFMYNVFKNEGIEVDNKYYEVLNDINIQDFVGQGKPACAKARETLTYLKDEGLKVASLNPSLKDNEMFKMAKDNLIQNDRTYRKYMAMYNADIIGYNYWVRFWPWRYLWKLFKVKTKDII